MSGWSDEAYKRIQKAGDQVGEWLDLHVSKVLEVPANAARIVILALVGLIAAQGLLLLNVPDGDLSWLGLVLKNVGPELAGIVFGVVAIDLLNERRQDEQLKEQLILQMGSSHNDVTDTAIRALLARGWLSDGSLSGAILPGADLSESILRGADLSGADLGFANLSGAVLWDADLSGAILGFANLNGAYLPGADLSGAYLGFANLSGANLWDADLSGAFLRGADLSDAYLWDADLSEAYLWGADLSEAILSGADLSEAILSGANLFRADLSDAYLWEADLSDAYLWEADLSRAELPSNLVINPDKWKVVTIESRTLRWSRD